MAKPDILKEAQEAFAECEECERENRVAAEHDIRFSRLEEQWPADVKEQRDRDGRPCLTINKLAPVIRQVANDARQNKPQIKVQPQDSDADPETAEVMSGLIRNIESSSDADVAYDTAVTDAISGGFGYFRINLAYACDDNWEQDIVFERVSNPFSIYRDPHSTAADSSDWNVAFVTDRMSKKAFEAEYGKGEAAIDWTSSDYNDMWREGEDVIVAEYWKREKVKRQILLLSDGRTVDAKAFKDEAEQFYLEGGQVLGQPRDVMSYKVTQRILNGVEVLSKTDWAGKYIPIIPVYGDEINLKGKRHFRSLIRSAIDAQRMFNYWSTQTTELVALAPKAPFIGPKGSFESDAEKWATANTQSHAHIEYDMVAGGIRPERQQFAGIPAGAMQEAMNASDHIKAVTGIYDASLGAKSNETSGRAIMARQREGDVSTFHFIDNLSRAIRHGGRVLIDLVPKVYGSDRVIRTLGGEGQVETVPLGKPVELRDKAGQPQMRPQVGPDGQPIAGPDGKPVMEPVTKIYDLGVGKYDLTVTAGPSFTTRREEAAVQMIEFIQAFPPAAPVIGDMLAKNLDWPGADELGERLKRLMPPVADPNGVPPEVQQQIQQMQMEGQALQAENQKLQADNTAAMIKAQADVARVQQDAEKLQIDAFRAETERMKVEHEIRQPTVAPKAKADAAA